MSEIYLNLLKYQNTTEFQSEERWNVKIGFQNIALGKQ